jgi:glucose-1-phosphate thymidylyltransferase
MKGIVLAGGLGSRLAPLTQNDNKHLLPVYRKRMVEYPLKTLVDAGISDIVLITGGKRPGAFLELLRSGRDHKISRLYYTYQEGNGGIADALKLAQPFIEETLFSPEPEPCVVILGDNYFEDGIRHQLAEWECRTARHGAGILLRKTDTPWYFGIAEVSGTEVLSIDEKPSQPKSDLAILGCYFFDATIWQRLECVEPSVRGELEITDVLKMYMTDGYLTHYPYTGYWSDMGTFDSWMEVSNRLAIEEKK